KNIASMIKREYRDEKAVKTAISGLYSGEFKIIEPDGTVEMLGGHTPEEFEKHESDEQAEDDFETPDETEERETSGDEE
ncbi:MAG: hypothetical protein ACI4V1_09390, partial [Eubacteriales bacterium]